MNESLSRSIGAHLVDALNTWGKRSGNLARGEAGQDASISWNVAGSGKGDEA
jgi:hypothetical protein